MRTINYTSWYHPGWEEDAIRLLFDPTMYSAGDDISDGYFYGIHLFESHKNYQTWGVPAYVLHPTSACASHMMMVGFDVVMQ